MNIFRKLQRVWRCQFAHIMHCLWCTFKPDMFYKRPLLLNKVWYASVNGYFPNFKHPQDFNAQLIAINLAAYRDEEQRKLRIQCADKYAVRQYVADKGLSEILNECYGVYDSFDEIDFEVLPDQFVLKTTNGSGQNYICKDKSKMDKGALKKIFAEWMAATKDFGLTTGEWHYSQIKPRIIAEKYLSTLGESTSIIDYKFQCIHGKVYGEFVCYDRIPGMAHHVNFDHYDANWNLTDGIRPEFHKNRRLIDCPKTFAQMKVVAEKLSVAFDYCRVDLYEIDGKIIFGELTFTPAGNMMTYYTQETLIDMQRFYESRKKCK